MNSRDRVLTALQHQEPDRVPFFYRNTPEVEQRLISELNLADADALLEYLNIDFRWVKPAYIGPELDDPETGIRQNIWGVRYKYVFFNDHAGYWEPLENPLKNITDTKALDDYPWPRLEWFDFDSIPAAIDKYGGYAIMTDKGYASPSFLQFPIQCLVGEEQSFMLPYTHPEFFEALVDKALEFQQPLVEKMMQAGGGKIDFFRIGEDLGGQQGLVMSPKMYRDFLMPGIQALVNIAKKYGAHYYHHSCGSVRALIPDLLDTGMEVLDPIQVTAAGMDPGELKAEFGTQLTYSGGVDEMHLLPNGSPDEVRQGVRDLLDIMAPGGGYFLGSTHNFQDDVPTENILAMYDAARDYNIYS
ncbi:uroporphyrinogen-III decarboxylase [bacterium]|nr:uroporphyrinogen-III decarboxylase [bacterium]